jgi:hypothetical protein
MPLKVIELDQAETFASLRDRLLRAGMGRVVLIPSPQDDVFQRGVSLVLLRRLIERERLEVGLVTTDRGLASRARALGLPTFATLTLAEHYRPGWWRARRPRERLGFPPGEAIRSREACQVKTGPVFAGVLSLIFLVCLLAAAAILLLVPRSTIVLRPATRPFQIITQVAADPSATRVSTLSLPAGEVRVSQNWEVAGATRGDAPVDRRLIRAQALQGLGDSAEIYLAPRVAPGKVYVPGSARFQVIDEVFEVGDDNRWRLSLQAELSGLTVSRADIERVAQEQLAALPPEGFIVQPATMVLEYERIPGRPDAFLLTARALGQARLDLGAITESIRGQHLEIAEGYLDQLPLAAPPEVWTSPVWWSRWFQRLPILAERIRIESLP